MKCKDLLPETKCNETPRKEAWGYVCDRCGYSYTNAYGAQRKVKK